MPFPGKPLPRSFFERSTLVVARELLGCRLCRVIDHEVLAWPITETEAYDGPQDQACHAHKGRTLRTEVMFGPGGVWYVYLCYGVHWMLNVVTGGEGYPSAVLIRGAGAIHGPGRLTKALAINGKLNGTGSTLASGLWIEAGEPLMDADVVRTPRIGVHYAGPDWAMRPYRFLPRARLKAAGK
jgi:DNA-3-methyladenine glycosylase